MSRGKVKSRVVENSVVGLGGNEFETSLIAVTANSVIKKGTVLSRDGNKFKPVDPAASEKPVAVNPFDIPNEGDAQANMSFRAIISGPVRADMLLINGVNTTDAENDMLRGASLIPIKTNDISRTE